MRRFMCQYAGTGREPWMCLNLIYVELNNDTIAIGI
jgi:hypothetical protein